MWKVYRDSFKLLRLSPSLDCAIKVYFLLLFKNLIIIIVVVIASIGKIIVKKLKSEE